VSNLSRQAQTDSKRDVEPRTSANGHEDSNSTPEADAQAELHQKLRSVQLEIDAVASTIKRSKSATGKQIDSSSGSADAQDQNKQRPDDTTQDDSQGEALQQALATERLKSLKKAKAQIQKEILQSDPSPSVSGNRKDKMLAMLVEEEPKRKKKPLKPPVGNKNLSTPRLKMKTYNDDDDFDAVLDGASAGFMETVSY
jgi:DNA excision repair protein ERCC-6